MAASSRPTPDDSSQGISVLPDGSASFLNLLYFGLGICLGMSSAHYPQSFLPFLAKPLASEVQAELHDGAGTTYRIGWGPNEIDITRFQG